MKNIILSITLMTTFFSSTIKAQTMKLDYKSNPYTLVYDGAITKNEKGKVNIHPVHYQLNGLQLQQMFTRQPTTMNRKNMQQ